MGAVLWAVALMEVVTMAVVVRWAVVVAMLVAAAKAAAAAVSAAALTVAAMAVAQVLVPATRRKTRSHMAPPAAPLPRPLWQPPARVQSARFAWLVVVPH